MDSSLRQYLVEATNGFAVSRHTDPIFSTPEYKPVLDSLYSLDRLAEEAFSENGKRQTSRDVDRFILKPEEQMSEDELVRLAKEFYLSQGFVQVEHKIFDTIFKQGNENVLVIITEVIDSVYVTETKVTVFEPVDMVGYENLETYLGEYYPQGLKSVAKEIYALAESTLGSPYEFGRWYTLFLEMIDYVFPRILNKEYEEQEGLYVSAVCPPDIDSVLFEPFMRRAGLAVMKACKSFIDNSYDKSLNQLTTMGEKLIGAYILGAGEDIKRYTEITTLNRRMWHARSN